MGGCVGNNESSWLEKQRRFCGPDNELKKHLQLHCEPVYIQPLISIAVQALMLSISLSLMRQSSSEEWER